MLFNFPVTNYQIRQIKFYARSGFIAFLTVFILGNVLTAIFRDSVKISKSHYILKEGFPLFVSQKDYIDLLKKYPYNPGTRLTFHRMSRGESYWDISNRYNLSIETIIAANPFIDSLIAREDIELAVPSDDGVLLAFDDYFDVGRMADLLNYHGEITGDYMPAVFKIISTDDIRFVFFKDKRPVIVNNSLEKLYNFKSIFQTPVKGIYTSLFGDRVDPFFHGMAFHNGIDILSRMGTPVKAAREGMVFFTGWRDGYGKTVMIQHNDGYSTLYGHFSKINVNKGDWVYKDDVIGLIGSTDRSTGPHLHFTIMRHGEIINPILFIW